MSHKQTNTLSDGSKNTIILQLAVKKILQSAKLTCSKASDTYWNLSRRDALYSNPMIRCALHSAPDASRRSLRLDRVSSQSYRDSPKFRSRWSRERPWNSADLLNPAYLISNYLFK